MWQVPLEPHIWPAFITGCVVFMNKEFDIIEEELNKLSFFTNVGKGLVYGRDRMDIFLEKAGHPGKSIPHYSDCRNKWQGISIFIYKWWTPVP